MKHIKLFESSQSAISTSEVWVIYRKNDTDISGYKIYLNKLEAEKECLNANENLKKIGGFVGPIERYFYSVYTLDDAISYISDAIKGNEFINSRSNGY